MADFGKRAVSDSTESDMARDSDMPEDAGATPKVGRSAAMPPRDLANQITAPLSDALPAPRPNNTAVCAPMGAPVCQPVSPPAGQTLPLTQPPVAPSSPIYRGLEEEVRHQQVVGLRTTGKSPIVANLFVALGVAALLWNGGVGKLAIAAWFAILVIILVGRYIVFCHRPAPPAARNAIWLRRFAIGSAITGLWWGVLTLSMFTGLTPNEFTLLAMVAAGMSAGAVASYAVYPPAAYGFFAPLLGILAAYYFAQATFEGAIMGSVALLYGGILAKVVRGVNGWRRELVDMDVQSRQMANELRIIADQSYAMENWFDAEGKLRWASPSALRVTGYTADELLAMDGFPLPLVHKDDKARIGAGMKAAGVTTPLREMEFRLIRKDGVTRWCSVVSQPALDEENRLIGFRASVRDVTENHELQEQLQEANTNLSTIAEYSYAWEVWVSPDGQLRWVSPSVANITGYTASECYAMDDYPFPLIHEDDHDQVRQQLTSPDRMMTHRRWEFRVRRKDGEIRLCIVDSQPAYDDQGKSVGLRASITDITEIKQLQEELSRSNDSLRIITDYSYAWESWFDNDVKLKWVSPSVERITGYKQDECYGIDSFPIPTIHPDDREMIAKGLRNATFHETDKEIEFRQLRKDGSITWCAVESRPAFDAAGERVGFRASVRDISRQKSLQQELERMATTDSLTGIINRRQFFNLGEAEVYRAARYGHALSVSMIDVDHFKKINDTHGHGVGDECLKALTRCVSSTIRRSDIFARIGGEEFIVMMPETEIADAAALADRLRLAVQKINVPLPAGMCRFTVSVGVAGFDHERPEIRQLLQDADDALYEAKGDGRNRVRVAQPDGHVGADMLAAE